MNSELIAKYDVPGPRYTSYPTVPHWDVEAFDVGRFHDTVRRAWAESGRREGVSVYVHLPFCESLCTFCGCTKRITRNHGVEQPYVDTVLAEWEQWIEVLGERPLVRELHLGGGTPTFFSPEHLERLVAGLMARAHRADDFEFGFEAHPNSTTREHLATLHRLGFRRLSLGVQDFDPDVQAIINRVQPRARVEAVVRDARDLGYASIGFDLVYGLPRQRPAGIVDTVDAVIEIAPDRIAFYGYAHVPWIRGLGQRRFSDDDVPRGAEKRALYEAGRARLEAAGYREIGLDHFALAHDALWRASAAGRLHRNFMGYTARHTSLELGLGMSAISDSWYGFAQNEKTVEAYSERVGAGSPPIFRGHLLDEEDLLVRRHVLDLMCRLETTWSDADLARPAVADARARLGALVADGIVEIEGATARVTERGRPFLRNACMALDARLWRSAPSSRLFSQAI